MADVRPRKRPRLFSGSSHRPLRVAAIESLQTVDPALLVLPAPDASQKAQWAQFDQHSQQDAVEGAGEGLDCPVRAGPNGDRLCGWRPKDGSDGFPDNNRVRAHVAGHGLVCSDCRRSYKNHKLFQSHRRHSICDETEADTRQPKWPLSQTPEELANFFERPKLNSTVEEIWLDGYKSLHPDWKHEGVLPTPHYRINVDRNRIDSGVHVNRPSGRQSTIGLRLSSEPERHRRSHNYQQSAEAHTNQEDSDGVPIQDNDLASASPEFGSIHIEQTPSGIYGLPVGPQNISYDFDDMIGALPAPLDEANSGHIHLSEPPEDRRSRESNDPAPGPLRSKASSPQHMAQSLGQRKAHSTLAATVPFTSRLTMRLMRQERDRNEKLSSMNDDPQAENFVLRTNGKKIERRTKQCELDVHFEPEQNGHYVNLFGFMIKLFREWSFENREGGSRHITT